MNHCFIKSILLILLILVPLCAYAQNVVNGFVKDIDGSMFPGVNIFENGTQNSTTSNIDGLFQLTTIQDTCTISFSSVGYDTKTIMVTKDTTLNVTLKIWDYESNWITVGSGYDAFNSTVSLLVSNGFDEHPLIHFEDFSQS